MIIEKVNIQRFRALEDFTAIFSNFTVIIGENDVGKTTCLTALKYFFNRTKVSDKQDFFRLKTDFPIQMVIDFKLSDDEKALPQYADRLRDNRLTVRMEWLLGKTPTATVDLGGKPEKLTPATFKEILPDDLFYLVPVNRPYSDDFKMTKDALFSKLVKAQLSEILGEPDIQDMAKLITGKFQRTVKGLVEELSELVREQMNNDKISISPDLKMDLLRGLEIPLHMSDERVPDIDISRRGAGTQNNCMIALFRLFAKYRTSNFILTMEEPENSLHPRGQRELLWALQGVSKNAQVICTTHSQIFLDLGRLENNLILTRKSAGNTISRMFNPKDLVAFREQMGIRISDVLLSGGGNCAVLVEGETELHAYPALMRIKGLDSREMGISVISMGGADSKKWLPYARLLDAYSIPFLTVLDSDKKKSKEDISRAGGKSFRAFKGVYCLTEGAFEDYLPLDLVAEVFNEEYDMGEQITESDFDQSKKGKERTKNFGHVLYKRKGAEARWEYDKVKIGERVCRKMLEKGCELHPDYERIFLKVKEIVEKS